MNNELKLLDTLSNLKEVRKQAVSLKLRGYEDLVTDLETGYQTVIDDILELSGLTEREIDLIWEITEV